MNASDDKRVGVVSSRLWKSVSLTTYTCTWSRMTLSACSGVIPTAFTYGG